MSSTGVSLSVRQIASKIIVYVILGLGSIVILLPLLWMISDLAEAAERMFFASRPSSSRSEVIWQNYPERA